MKSSNTHNDMLFLGLANAVQALAMTIIDTDEKRNEVTKYLENFAEKMLRSDNSESQKQSYLDGLALLGLAVNLSKDQWL